MSAATAPSASTGPKPKKSVALSGTVAGNTALCTVGRSGNDLHYRGYDILDIAETCEFEEIAYLLVHGKLPTVAELAGYKIKLKALRGLPAQLKAALEQLPAADDLVRRKFDPADDLAAGHVQTGNDASGQHTVTSASPSVKRPS